MKKLMRNSICKNESVPLNGTDSKNQETRKRVPPKKYWKFDFGDVPSIWWDDGWGRPLSTQ